MEHSLHIACKHFVETIAPASPVALCKKVHAAVKKAKDADGDLNLDKLDNVLATLNLKNAEGSDDPNSDGSDNELEFTTGDVLGKALALVKQVCAQVSNLWWAQYIQSI